MNIKISRDKNGGLNIDISDKMIETNPNIQIILIKNNSN